GLPVRRTAVQSRNRRRFAETSSSFRKSSKKKNRPTVTDFSIQTLRPRKKRTTRNAKGTRSPGLPMLHQIVTEPRAWSVFISFLWCVSWWSSCSHGLEPHNREQIADFLVDVRWRRDCVRDLRAQQLAVA